MIMDYGKLLLSRRLALNLSRQTLSEMSGISARTIQSIEHGESDPSISVLSELLGRLGYVINVEERVKYG